MKTIIISDIKSKAESIIPYGLNLAKFLESEVEIVHVIDVKSLHGVYSSYADSQSIVPGEKLSHDDILRREKNQAHILLDQILSREASRLNYPLKINVTIEETGVELKIKELIKENPSPVFIMNSVADGYIFDTESEIFNVIKNIGAISLLVPPGKKFREPDEVLLLTDFSLKGFENYYNVFQFLEKLKINIHAVNVVKNEKKYLLNDLSSKEWIQTLKNFFPNISLKTNALKGEDYTWTLLSHIEKNTPDIILVINKYKGFLNRILQKDLTREIFSRTNLPFLLYS